MAQLSLWADYSHLSSIRRFVGEVGEDLGIPERELYELELAVDEACTNVIEHGYNCLLYTSPSPRDRTRSRMPSSA